MFFLIGGVQPRTKKLEATPRTCPACGRYTLYLKRTDQYLSLFFIPLFPIKKGLAHWGCDECRARYAGIGDPRDIRSAEKIIRLCHACGKPLGEDHLFCPYCGKKY